jgi:RNA polymerase sigma factor (sigma-70 family)
MRIEAKIRFRHGRIVEVLRAAGLSVKELANRAGWNPVTLQAMIRLRVARPFRGDPDKRQRLVRALQAIDPTVTDEEVFPPELPKAVAVFHPRETIADVDVLLLADRIEKHSQLESPETSDATALLTDKRNAIEKALLLLPSRSRDIILMYYGIGRDKPMTLEEIGDALLLSRERVRTILYKAKTRLLLDHRTSRMLWEVTDNEQESHEDPETAEDIEREWRNWLGYVPKAPIIEVD